MLIVLFIIFLLMIILGTIIYKVGDEKWRADWSEGLTTFSALGIMLGCICEFCTVIAIIFNCYNISTLKISDSKITMYEQENADIQNQISEIIENYKNYEQNTYSESLKSIDTHNTDIIVLTQLYPDLKSNEMVNKQIDIYQENNNKIKELKEEKLNSEVAKWWLYFGKIEEAE